MLKRYFLAATMFALLLLFAPLSAQDANKKAPEKTEKEVQESIDTAVKRLAEISKSADYQALKKVWPDLMASFLESRPIKISVCKFFEGDAFQAKLPPNELPLQEQQNIASSKSNEEIIKAVRQMGYFLSQRQDGYFGSYNAPLEIVEVKPLADRKMKLLLMDDQVLWQAFEAGRLTEEAHISLYLIVNTWREEVHVWSKLCVRDRFLLIEILRDLSGYEVPKDKPTMDCTFSSYAHTLAKSQKFMGMKRYYRDLLWSYKNISFPLQLIHEDIGEIAYNRQKNPYLIRTECLFIMLRLERQLEGIASRFGQVPIPECNEYVDLSAYPKRKDEKENVKPPALEDEAQKKLSPSAQVFLQFCKTLLVNWDPDDRHYLLVEKLTEDFGDAEKELFDARLKILSQREDYKKLKQIFPDLLQSFIDNKPIKAETLKMLGVNPDNVLNERVSLKQIKPPRRNTIVWSEPLADKLSDAVAVKYINDRAVFLAKKLVEDLGVVPSAPRIARNFIRIREYRSFAPLTTLLKNGLISEDDYVSLHFMLRGLLEAGMINLEDPIEWSELQLSDQMLICSILRDLGNVKAGDAKVNIEIQNPNDYIGVLSKTRKFKSMRRFYCEMVDVFARYIIERKLDESGEKKQIEEIPEQIKHTDRLGSERSHYNRALYINKLYDLNELLVLIAGTIQVPLPLHGASDEKGHINVYRSNTQITSYDKLPPVKGKVDLSAFPFMLVDDKGAPLKDEDKFSWAPKDKKESFTKKTKDELPSKTNEKPSKRAVAFADFYWWAKQESIDDSGLLPYIEALTKD